MVLRLHRGVHGDARGAHVRPEQLASHVKNRVMLRASPRRFAPITSCGANALAAALAPCVRHVICTITSYGKSRGLFSSSGAKVYVHSVFSLVLLLSGGEAWCNVLRIYALTLSATNTRFGSQARYAHAMAALRRGRLRRAG